MVLFHYHSTFHFIWALMGIPYEFPLDPIDGWWALLKGLLPPFSLFIVFFTGLITKRKNLKNGIPG